MEPDANSRCPVCGFDDETQEHILQCTGGKMQVARFNALIKLRSSIVTKHGTSHTWTLLHSNLAAWINGRRLPPLQKSLPPNLRSELTHALILALEEQHLIGWEFAFRGYLSSKWTLAQQLEHPKSSIQGIRQQWLRSVIKGIWSFTFTLWDTRNQVLHSNTTEARDLRSSTIDAQISRWYSLQAEFATSDRRLFDIPLEMRLATSAQSKKHWLVLVSRYHSTTKTRRQGNQPLISKFFTRILQPAPPHQGLVPVDSSSLQHPPNIQPLQTNPEQRNSATNQQST